VEFIETSVFTRQIRALISEDSYRALQTSLILHPDTGEVIQGTHGARKMRWMVAGRGKSYGIRVIYVQRDPRIYFLIAFEKSRKADLSPDERKALGEIIKDLE
jgi:RelE toxin of RelE / RelB toxin-antitoxin system